MARRKQEGNRFFRLDVDFFSDKKVKILKARYGADGVTLYLYILCEIYKAGYYLKIDEDFEFIVSDDLSMDSNKVKQVLNFLLERSLFDNTLFQSDKVLTSAGRLKNQTVILCTDPYLIFLRTRHLYAKLISIIGPKLKFVSTQ